MEKVIVAKLVSNGNEYIGKRKVALYDGTDNKTKHANVGLTLEVQRLIRQALAEKNGLRKVNTQGAVRDLTDIEEV